MQTDNSDKEHDKSDVFVTDWFRGYHSGLQTSGVISPVVSPLFAPLTSDEEENSGRTFLKLPTNKNQVGL